MGNINESMMALGKVRSAIRDIFEYGNARAKEIGRENIFDFSLGNPSVPAPDVFNDIMENLAKNPEDTAVYAYTSAQGAEYVRQSIADNINERFNARMTKDDIYMCCGAAAALSICMKAIANAEDEIVAIAPYFPEYRVFAEASGARFVQADPDTKEFQINFPALENIINTHTKAVIINTPNNPTGVILKRENLERLCSLLCKKQKEFGHPIFLISDEPYRELCYDGAEVPYMTLMYDNTIVCYSFSKALSIPGARIGYVALSPDCESHDDVYAAICGAGRALGYVCAPAMLQQAVSKCLGATSDISVYKKNRDVLYNALTSYGYECVHPDGAFYLFVKSPEPDAKAFCEKAKKYELLLVPSDSFGCPGYVRIAYCVSPQTIENSLPSFEKLMEEYKSTCQK